MASNAVKVKAKMGGRPIKLKRVDDLRIGDEIATVLVAGHNGQKLAAKTVKVQTFDVCDGNWRTHVHINGNECYDSRTYVNVVAK